MKTTLLWITFILAIISGIILASLPLVELGKIANTLTDSTSRNTLGLTSVILMFPSVVIGIYAADCVWLLLWRGFATREEVQKVAFSFPTTKFDRWLTKKLGPKN
jgi:hypothetical protein